MPSWFFTLSLPLDLAILGIFKGSFLAVFLVWLCWRQIPNHGIPFMNFLQSWVYLLLFQNALSPSLDPEDISRLPHSSGHPSPALPFCCLCPSSQWHIHHSWCWIFLSTCSSDMMFWSFLISLPVLIEHSASLDIQ